MGQKISIPQQNQPFRRQATLGGDVSFRNLSESKENNSVVMATVTKVYYKQGRVDFKLANTATDTVSEAGNGIGSAPIPVDFYGYKADGKVFGHYRPIQIGDRVAVAYLWGHQESPIILGVYPNQASSYEFVAPPFATDSGDDKDENVKEYALADRKINPDGNVTYRTGKGSLYQTLNGHSFALIDDSPLYDQLWLDYEHIGAFRDADNKEINPLTETAGEWLLVHEDNQEGENADNHRTRFYVNKHGEFQIILSKSDSMDSALVVEGSKDKGFTAQQLFDIPEGDAFGGDMNHRQPELDKAPTYVKFNLGGSNQVASIEASSQAESQAQTTNFSVKPDGVYINGKAISDLIYNAGNKNDQKISDITNDIDDINQHLADKDKSDAQKEQDLQKKWADYEQKVADNAKAASDAAKSAERAGDDAKAAGQAAVRAGDNAVNLTDDIKNKIIYYSSISKEKDVHIPGKYLIINTDTYIANGTIKTAYIEDGAISSAKIGSEAVGTAQIARAAVGTLQVADGAIGTAQIKDLAVTDEKVGNLTFNHMIGQTLDANKIKVKNISGDDISADTITANHLKIGSLSEISGDLGNIIKGNISASDDPNKGVVINGLDADDPDKYTASKKAALFREVNALNASYQATLAYAQSVGIDATALQQAQQAMSDGLSPLFMNMGETTTMDHNKVVELEKALQQAISDIQNQFRYQLGTTANGKSTIYSGSQQPAHPKENDLWMKDTGSGTDIEIYNGAGWVSPSLNVVNNMNAALKNMPKTFFQSAQPDPKTTQLNEGDLWYKLTKDSNGNFVYTYYKWDNSVHMWVKLLNNGEVTNQSSIKQLQGDLEQARDSIKDDGGGINLYTGTENFSNIAGRSWFHRSDDNWTLTDRRDPNGNLEMQKNGGAWHGLGQAITVEPGKYTFSCYLWVHLTGNETLNFYAGDKQYGGTATVGVTGGTTQFTANDSDKYIHVTITYNVTKGGVLAIRPELNQDSGTLWVSSYKLEKGSQATPWCRNGNDYMAGIAAVQEDVNSATAAIQQAKANAASDAAKIRADVARIESEVASAKSASQDSINALQSDIDAAKKDLADTQSGLLNAQSAIKQNQKLINDSVAKINNDINQDRKDIAVAQQANTDTANKLDSFTKQAVEQGNTIKELQTDNDSTKLTIANIKGNVSQVQSSVTGLTANLKDTNDNLAAVKSTADSLSATIADHGKNISALQATAQSLSSTLSDASGRLSKVEQTAQEHSVTIGNLRSEVEWKQVSSNSLLDTMKSAGHFWGTGKTFTGNPGHIKDTDQVRVVVEVPSDDSISQIFYANNIVWQRSFNGNTWSEWVRSANQSDVDTLQGNITQVKQTADGLTTTLRNAQGDITNLQTTARGLSEQITNVQGDITALQTDVTGIKTTIADHDKNIHTLQADAKSLTDNMEDAQSNISTLRKTATSLDSELKDHAGRISKVEQSSSIQATTLSDLQGNLSQVEQKADSNTTTISSISKNAMQDRGVITDTKTSFDSLTQLGTYSIKAIGLPKMPEQHYGTLVVSGSAGSGWLSQQFVADTTGNVYTRVFSNNAWSAWKQGGSQDAINQVKQTADSNSATIRNVQGDVSTLKQTATDVEATLAGHEGDIHTLQADSKTLRDDMTDAQGNISSLKKSAGSINESIVKLDQSVKTGAENNVQLVRKSDFEDGDKGGWDAQTVVATDPPAELGQSGMKVLQTNVRDAYENDIWYSVKPGEKFDVDFWCKPSPTYDSQFGLIFADKNKGNNNWIGVYVNKSDQWKHYTGTITAPSNATFARPWFQITKDTSNTTDTALLAKPSIRRQNTITVAAIQQITASIDGLQSTVAKKDDVVSMISQKADSIEAGITGKLSSLNYGGLVLDKNGATLTSGNTHVYLNGTHGFQIQKGTSDIFHVDTDGNLTIKGDSVVGNISGVNFTGTNLNLAGSMKVSGSILAGDDGKGNAKVVINNDGLNMTSGDINLGDDKGTHVHIANDGTLTANQANISGNITATKLLLNDPTGKGQSSINLGGKFMVDSQGTVTANKFNSTNITVTGGEIKGTTIDGNHIKGGTITATNINASIINGGTMNTVTIGVSSTITGSSIIGGTIRGSHFETNAYAQNYESKPPYAGYGTESGSLVSLGSWDDYGLVIRNNAIDLQKTLSWSNTDGTHDQFKWLTYPHNNVTGADNYLFMLNEGEDFQRLFGYDVEDTRYSNSPNHMFIPLLIVNNRKDLQSLDIDYYIRTNTDANVYMISWCTDLDKSITVDFHDQLEVTGMSTPPDRLPNENSLINKASMHRANDSIQLFSDSIDIGSKGSNNIGVGLWVEKVGTTGDHLYNTYVAGNSLAQVGKDYSWNLTNNFQVHHQRTTITNNANFIQESYDESGASRNTIMNNGRLQLTNSEGPNVSTNTFRVDGSGISFSDNALAMNSADANQKIAFLGNGKQGIYFDSYGNIQGLGGSAYWRIKNKSGNSLVDFPMNENYPITFNKRVILHTGGESDITTTWVAASSLYNGAHLPAIGRSDWWNYGAQSGMIAISNGSMYYFSGHQYWNFNWGPSGSSSSYGTGSD